MGLLLLSVSVFGQDPAHIQAKAMEIVRQGDQAAKTGRNGEAENQYKAALEECSGMPPGGYHCRTHVLWSLGRFYSGLKDRVNAEAVYKERLNILVAHQKTDPQPDLDVGIALFDLQSIMSLPDLSRDAEEQNYMSQARHFYEDCKMWRPDLRSVCDRRLADVEGLHGSLLVVQHRFDEAAPFLIAVTNRPNSGVRKEVMTSALKGYALVLIQQGRPSEAAAYVDRARLLEQPQH